MQIRDEGRGAILRGDRKRVLSRATSSTFSSQEENTFRRAELNRTRRTARFSFLFLRWNVARWKNIVLGVIIVLVNSEGNIMLQNFN